MPNLKSAKKRLRQNEREAEVNKRVKTRIKSTRKTFITAVTGSDEAAKTSAYSSYCSALDKAVKSGVIKKNNATRNKTRAAHMLKHGIVEPARKMSKRKSEAKPDAPIAAGVESSDEVAALTARPEAPPAEAPPAEKATAEEATAEEATAEDAPDGDGE